MALQQPWDLQALCYTSAEDRQGFNAAVVVEGVYNQTGTDLAVTTAGADLDLNVAIGRAVIFGDDDAPDQGPYQVRNDAIETVTADDPDATNPRIDQVIITVRDAEYGGLDNDAVFDVLAGTPTGGANLTNLTGAAALPDNSIRLAYVLIPADASAPFGPIGANDIKDARTLVGAGPKMLDYTPTWGASLTLDAVSKHRWTRSGGLVTVRFDVKFDASGSGDWSMSLPVPPATSTLYQHVGTAMYTTAAGSNSNSWLAYIDASASVVQWIEAFDNPGALLSGAAAADDQFTGIIQYEPA